MFKFKFVENVMFIISLTLMFVTLLKSPFDKKSTRIVPNESHITLMVVRNRSLLKDTK
jgi:hypothetical protein